MPSMNTKSIQRTKTLIGLTQQGLSDFFVWVQ
ncbi:uncharacterized protein METZ01_LOCUS257711, partial [marine metagenome]